MSEPLDAPTPGCGCTRHHLAIGVLAVLLGIATTGWVMTATMRNQPAVTPRAEEPRQDHSIAPPPIDAKPKVEKIPVWVAVKDLPVGTVLTKAELGKYAVKKDMAMDALPPAFVINEEELHDRRLTRPVLKDETFNPGALTKSGTLMLPEGMDMISMPVSVSNTVAGFVGPGSKVDVIATVRIGNEIRAFPLLIDMLVVAVDTHTSYDNAKGEVASPNNVSFAATQEQALLLALAKQRGCHMELLLRHPGKKVDPDYDVKKVFELLKDLSR